MAIDFSGRKISKGLLCSVSFDDRHLPPVGGQVGWTLHYLVVRDGHVSGQWLSCGTEKQPVDMRWPQAKQ